MKRFMKSFHQSLIAQFSDLMIRVVQLIWILAIYDYYSILFIFHTYSLNRLKKYLSTVQNIKVMLMVSSEDFL